MYFTTSKPLGGRIKQRYDDFLVKEVYLDSNNKKTVCEILNENVKQDELLKIPVQDSNSDYLHMHMQKTNTDLQNVIKSLALLLRCSKSRFGFAGLKDKRGITSQRISIFNPDIDLLSKFNKQMVKIHNFSYNNHQVEIGDLLSNQFEINVRQITKSLDQIWEILDDFKLQIAKGIPNRFGEQRFGGVRSVTHEVGKLFIEGKFEDAVIHYLTKTSDLERDDVKAARELIKNKDYKGALKAFPRKDYRYELAILQHLNKNPNDFVNAFKMLPDNIVYLFPHAYQSYLFNKYLDLRIEKYGADSLNVQDGDIVDSEGYVLGPLFGFEFELANGEVGEIERKVLEQENVDCRMFNVKDFSQVSTKGSRRRIKLDIRDFDIIDVNKDIYNDSMNYCKIKLELDKGCYATTLTEELIK